MLVQLGKRFPGRKGGGGRWGFGGLLRSMKSWEAQVLRRRAKQNESSRTDKYWLKNMGEVCVGTSCAQI